MTVQARAGVVVPRTLTGTIGLGLLLAMVGCQTVPYTGRQQLILIPEQTEIRLGLQSYLQASSKYSASENPEHLRIVRQVGSRIAAVSDKPGYQWEYKVFESDVPNAFALPGGKVAVFDKLLECTANEAQLATVMGHEVGHVIARHGGERMSQGVLVAAGAGALAASTQNKSSQDQQLILAAYGVAAGLGIMRPFSRQQESEADTIGLILMAKAGYDPRAAIPFWEKMARGSGSGTPEFLSTHPSDARRIAGIRARLPEVLKIYEAAPAKYGLGESIEGAKAPCMDPVPNRNLR